VKWQFYIFRSSYRFRNSQA